MRAVLDLVTVGNCMAIGSSSERMDCSVDRVYSRALINLTLHFGCCSRAVHIVVSIAFHSVKDLRDERQWLNGC